MNRLLTACFLLFVSLAIAHADDPCEYMPTPIPAPVPNPIFTDPGMNRDFTGMLLQQNYAQNNIMYAELLARQRVMYQPVSFDQCGQSQTQNYNVTDNTDYNAQAKAIYAQTAYEAVKGYDGNIIKDVISLPFTILSGVLGMFR